MAVLKPFEATTKEIPADKHVSIFKVIPPANSRQCLTGAITEKDTPLVSNLSYQMRHRFTNIEYIDVDLFGSPDEEISVQ